MKKNFKKIVINVNETESTLLISNGNFSIEYDSIQGVIIIRDSEEKTMFTTKVSHIEKFGDRDTWNVKCEDNEYLVYIEDDTLYIVKL